MGSNIYTAYYHQLETAFLSLNRRIVLLHKYYMDCILLGVIITYYNKYK